MSRADILQKLLERKAVAVIRAKDPEKLRNIIQALAAGGITFAEITMTVPGAIQLIERMTKELDSNIVIGVGSVLNAETASLAIKAGAKYVVSPVLKEDIIMTAHEYDIPAMPGCFTPTEIQRAHELGADIIKVFPADILGMGFFKSVLAPMPHLKLMPTGGVTLTNPGEWIKAGASAVGLGSALLDAKAIDLNNFEQITSNARTVMNSLGMMQEQVYI
ncbi:MAG: bifunctional 4-hydroxy-2-oxoglutarate aldolase/2-dehydro-3-deoxy-phosphogluconate aldolase [Ignavibacteriales bacterium]|nr:MAG: bifunctional 4-hydroxy-2-oxoglutarate aldolase/2-dehydro-3-deoxy-phosphogluconate aldolase [Ignavibacteriales bacterium]